MSYIAGGLGAGGGAAVGGTSAAITAAAGSSVLAAFAMALADRRTVAKFLDRHYVAFAKPKQ